MPEGDTIFRTARTLRTVLEHRRLRRLESPLPEIGRRAARLNGRKVVQVEARGKNLLIRFDDGSVLHSHMKMSGSWHVYRAGERWQKPLRAARVILETDDDMVAVCFGAPVVELLGPLQARHHRWLDTLGPDLLDPQADLGEAIRRLRRRPDLPIGEAVMAQQLVAGIGNVYKSETLFLRGIDPGTTVAALSGDALGEILHTARELLRRNLHGFPRRTRSAGAGRYWVYGRRGQPCRRCGTQIELRRQGDSARSTYSCPTCQPARG